MADVKSASGKVKDLEMQPTSATSKNKMDYRFSQHCGENVELSNENFKATWRHRFSDGVAFSSQPIQKYNKLRLDLTGTGHAYVGTISRDPTTIKNMRSALSNDVTILKDLKVHKRLCAIDVRTQTHEGRQYASFNIAGEWKHVETEGDTWLFLYIKFGNLVAVFQSDDKQNRSFHHVTGSNIHCMDQGRRSIKLQVENPSAICCLNKRLKPGYSIAVQTKPLVENGHVPSRCHLKLGFIELDPSDLRSGDPESFNIDRKTSTPKRWTLLHKFPKENVDGMLRIYLTHKGELFYNHDSGVEGTFNCRLKDLNAGVLIVLDLFRTEATVTESHDEDSYENVDKNYDYVTPDVDFIEKMKERLRLSDKKREHKPEQTNDSSDGYLKMVDINQNGDEIDRVIAACKRSPRLKRCAPDHRKIPSPSNFELCN